jgi:hypothetical protein
MISSVGSASPCTQATPKITAGNTDTANIIRSFCIFPSSGRRLRRALPSIGKQSLHLDAARRGEMIE